MRVVALDLSLTATGIAIHDPEPTGRPATHTSIGTIATGKMRGMERIRYIRDTIRAALYPAPDLVILESQFKGRALIELFYLGGVVHMMLYDMGLPYLELAPQKIKMLATGKGVATKDHVMLSAERRLSADLVHTERLKDNNQADALWLLQFVRQAYRLPGAVDLPKSHTRALKGIAWPDLKGSG